MEQVFTKTDLVLTEVFDERAAQDRKWGEQNHPDGTGDEDSQAMAQMARAGCQAAFAAQDGTWFDILREEVYEAGAEADPKKLRAELVQVAAVCVAWIEAIDRRTPQTAEAK